MRGLSKITIFILLGIGFCLNTAFAGIFDERNKPGDDKKAKAKRDDTTHYVISEESIIESPDTALILFPSNDLYATWDTSIIHPYNFADCFRADSLVIKLTEVGDGGFMMNCQELETALRVGTPFVTLIFNDGGYGLIEWKQESYFGKGRSSFVRFGNPDFVKFAESMGLKGYRVESATDLVPILKEALAQDVPAVIDCPVDYSENSRFSQKAGELNCEV